MTQNGYIDLNASKGYAGVHERGTAEEVARLTSVPLAAFATTIIHIGIRWHRVVDRREIRICFIGIKSAKVVRKV